MRRWLFTLIASCCAILIVCVAMVIVAAKEAPQSTDKAEVTKEGGTYTLEGITITVAPNTVMTPTTLTVSSPATNDDPTRPFSELKSPNVQFDISFAGGLQPLEPLDVKIPISDNFLPPGAVAEHALIYSPNEEGEWRLSPSVVENGALHTKLEHLSPKHITFVPPATVFDSILNAFGGDQGRKDCSYEHGDPGSRVLLRGSGWEKNDKSVVQPCLVEQGGDLKLQITNKNNIMWSIATNGPAITSGENTTDVAMIKLIARSMPHDKNVKAYLAEEHDAWADINSNGLPLTVQLRADPGTFLASSAWLAVKFSVGVFSGTSGNEALKIAERVVSAPELIDCLAKAIKSAKNDPVDVADVISIALSRCGEEIATQVKLKMPDPTLWERAVNAFFTVADGITSGIDTITKAYAGIVQQLKGDVVVKVEQEGPPCATSNDFATAVTLTVVTGASEIKCSNGWAYGKATSATRGRSGMYLIRYMNGKWILVRTLFEPLFYEDPEANKICQELPSDFREQLCVHV